MTPDTTEIQREKRSYSAAWFAAAMGASIGIAALAYRRRPRSRWNRAVRSANELIQTARKETKPWMGAAAGTAAAGTALAWYMRKPKESGWQQARKIASRARTQATSRWASLAATTAISLASVAYANKAQRRTIRGIDAKTAGKINSLTEKGLWVLDRIRNIREQSGKLYERGRHVIA